MEIKIINLSKSKAGGFNSFDATFSVDGELQPLRISGEDNIETYGKIERLLGNPNQDLEVAASELYRLMSPIANVKETIKGDFYLSKNMSIVNGRIKFGEHNLEESLSNHILSLLDDDNTPKDSKLWESYIRFLDNLHQNVNEKIREQLFRWIDYENQSGHGFGFTEDGCIVGYKGTDGTILEPMSKFTGTAIVDGIEVTGHIPNKVGSVIKMPRSAVQFDPSVGCSEGLHVGSRNYATSWAPILLLVKVNPRDVVSVPYEVDSQKMRVCEYTVLEVTDSSAEHKRYYSNESDESYESEDFDDCDESEYFEDEIEDSFYSPTENKLEITPLTLLDARKLDGSEVYVEYGHGKSFEGVISSVFESYNPGVIIRSESGDYKHIKLNRITHYTTPHVAVQEKLAKPSLKDLVGQEGEEILVNYDGKQFKGVISEVYDDSSKPGVIIRSKEDVIKHIKLDRIDSYVLDGVDSSEEEKPGTRIEIEGVNDLSEMVDYVKRVINSAMVDLG